ncbi:hypothetical protein EDF46_3191 [Frondihabitans sp. PhB188]|nr:hypothetical protein EDF46_3191 [Frondihabitans sp. PhB188]
MRPRAARDRRRQHRAVLVGVALVSIGYLAITGFASATLAWTGTVDSYEHLDYVWQVLHGHLPGPLGHEWTPGAYASEGNDGRQLASAHPPVYYAVMAVLAGPLLESSHWHVAVAIIRGANTLFGLGGLLAAAWVGWMVGRRHRVHLAIALPALAGAPFAYLRYSSDVYNDTLVAALSMAALAIAVRLVVAGPSWRFTVLLAVVAALALGTKATAVLTVGVVAVALVAACIVHADRRSPFLTARAAVMRLLVLGGVPAAAFGWFYVRNAGLSGAWYRSTEVSQVSGRTRRGLVDVLTDPDYYLIIPRGLIGHGTAAFGDIADAASLAVFAVGAGLTVAAVVARRKRVPELGAAQFLLIIMFAGHLLGSYLLQLSHSVGYGAYNWRYFLPSSLSVALLLGTGASLFGRRVAAVVVPVVVAVMWAGSSISFVLYAQERGHKVAPTGRGFLHDAGAAAFANGLPGWLPTLLLVLAAASIAGVGAVLWRYAVAPHPAAVPVRASVVS